MTAKWTAIAREAGSAAEHIGIGVTALGKATYAFPAYYSQAFFALSLGLERSCKLALAVHHAVTHGGSFPPERELRAYSHDLKKLVHKCDDVAKQHYVKVQRTPNTAIHRDIIEIRSDFASNITRYYNLQVITEHPPTNLIDRSEERRVGQ